MSNSHTQITAALTSINAQFDQAFNSKKAEEIASLYDANAVVMPAPAGDPVVGSQAIQTFFLKTVCQIFSSARNKKTEQEIQYQ